MKTANNYLTYNLFNERVPDRETYCVRGQTTVPGTYHGKTTSLIENDKIIDLNNSLQEPFSGVTFFDHPNDLHRSPGGIFYHDHYFNIHRSFDGSKYRDPFEKLRIHIC